MGFLSNLFRNKKDVNISEQNFKHNIYSKEISQYSSLPRYYYIEGEQYDIDSPESIASIPVCETHFNINGEDWGIDTILREHLNRYYSHIPDSIKETGYPKISEIEWAGFKKESALEKNVRLSQEKEQLELEAKLKAISISDMEQFHFKNYKMCSPIYDNNQSIMLISPENQTQVATDIETLNEYVQKACDEINIKEKLYIHPQELVFDTKINTRHNVTQYYTYFECVPYTKTGKTSKYPLVLHYATSAHHTFNPTNDFFGTIHYMQDGSIGKAHAIYCLEHTMYSFDLGLTGKTLCVKKVEKSSKEGKKLLFKV